MNCLEVNFSATPKDSFIACGELDPINRRLSSLQRPEVIVQVVVLAKDEKIKDLLHQVTNVFSCGTEFRGNSRKDFAWGWEGAMFFPSQNFRGLKNIATTY